ncbi:MAG: lysophospholipid acyltransferase family protein [Eubacteriales bacterium]
MKAIGRFFRRLPARIIFSIWSLWNHILYPPRIRYPDRETKKAFRRTPCILIANHTEHTDGYFLPQMLKKRHLYTYVTRKWYDKKNLKWLFSNLPYLPIDLTSLDTEWLARGEEVLKAGGSILIFPEGKLVREDMLGAFHPGALMLARKTGVPVYPVALVGKYRKFRRKTVLVGRPLDLDLHRRGRPGQILREEAEKCREVLSGMLGLPYESALPAPAPAPNSPSEIPTPEPVPLLN